MGDPNVINNTRRHGSSYQSRGNAILMLSIFKRSIFNSNNHLIGFSEHAHVN